MIIFNITKDSTLPYLEIEPINDGRHDYGKLYYAIQAADVTFSMINVETNIKVIANSKADIVFYNDESCEEKFKIRYKWNSRDTKKVGKYKGVFKINFDGNIKSDGMEFPDGIMNVPISEELYINILP